MHVDHFALASAALVQRQLPAYPAAICINCPQARSYEEATSSVLGWYLRNAQNRALSHPLPVMRAREIDRWSQSAQYKALVSKNRAHWARASQPPEKLM